MSGERSAERARRRIFVGDIQGCADELRALLDRLRFDPAADDLQPVGDYVNRGPDSAGVLRLVRDAAAGGVLGNHDLHLLRIVTGVRKPRPADTIGDVLAAPDRNELMAWLASRPFVRAWDDVLLVHAGLHPAWKNPERVLAGIDPLHPSAEAEFSTKVRYCTPDGQLPESDHEDPGPPFAPWYRLHRDQRTVVFGHWSARGLVSEPRVRGLDTGCVWGGKLTAWIAEEDRFVSVPAKKAYARPTRS
ncbi:MAG: metallophosphoesterase [Candidatus Binatia bacterium]